MLFVFVYTQIEDRTPWVDFFGRHVNEVLRNRGNGLEEHISWLTVNKQTSARNRSLCWGSFSATSE